MSHTRLVLLSADDSRPSACLTVDAAGMVVARGALSPASPAPLGAVRTVLIVPGPDVAARWMEVPGETRAQAAGAAAAALEEDLAAARETLHVAVGEREGDGRRLVCVVARERMQGFLDRAAAIGLQPEVAIPDYLLLSEPEDDSLIAADMGETVAVRGRRLAFGCERELVGLLAGERTFQQVSEPSRIEGMFVQAMERPAVNLRQGAFALRPEITVSSRDYRLAAVLAVILLLSPLVLLGGRIAHDLAEARALERRARVEATAATGPVEGDPVEVLTQRAAAAGAARRFLGAAAALVDATARVNGQLQAFSYEEEGVLRASLVHSNFTDPQAIRAALEPAGFAVREDASSELGDRILTEITLTPAP